MSFILNVPPSVLAKTAKAEKEAMGIDPDSDEPKKNKREDYKKLKELEEARKAGTVPAMKDEEGKDINPHIPQYIMQAPWYIGAMEPTLRHQREPQEQKKTFAGMDEWYKRGVKQGSLATKYRKGACENCGAVTHQKRDCLERPRRIGARFSGQDIAPDEYLQSNLEHDFEGKRDRWNGYDPNEHKRVIEEFAKLEEAKKQLKADRFDDGAEGEKQDEDKGEDDGDKYAEGMDMPGQEFKGKERITVRNLRIREDTAKYLFNLDVNSAFYDPKTRSMRENPFTNKTKDPGELPYAGDNFVRASGMAQTFASQQMFAWDTYEKGVDVHLQADPTRLELLTAEVDKKKADYKVETKKSILEKYGGQEHLDAPPKQLLLAQTEDYTEYSRYGTIIKGQEKAVVRSRYDEDVHVNNHTSVYGSYWRHGQWGYKCCHSYIKGSYCTGEAGKSQAQDNILALQSSEAKSLLEQHREKRSKAKRKKRKDKKRKSKKKKKPETSSSSSSSESSSDSSESESEEAKEEKVKEAIKKEKLRRKEVERMMLLDERKRPYNSMYTEVQPTDAEMEAYHRKKHLTDDPMLHFN